MSVKKLIYASKIYKSSTRKARINAAFVSPHNAALLQQLAADLDEQYQTSENVGEADAKFDTDSDVADSALNPDLEEGFSAKDNLVKVSDFGGNGPSKLGPKPTFDDEGSEAPDADMPSDESLPDVPDLDVPDDIPEPDLPEEPVEESTKITSCTEIDTAVIKGSLNSREDTAGVNRIRRKENELWIYYNDNINLNDVMVEVVEFLNASGETNLEFNRLARTDNAIVFIITDESESIQPLEPVEASGKVNPVSGLEKSGDRDVSSPNTSEDDKFKKVMGLIDSLRDETNAKDPVVEVTSADGELKVVLKSGKTKSFARADLDSAYDEVCKAAGINIDMTPEAKELSAKFKPSK